MKMKMISPSYRSSLDRSINVCISKEQEILFLKMVKKEKFRAMMKELNLTRNRMMKVIEVWASCFEDFDRKNSAKLLVQSKYPNVLRGFLNENFTITYLVEKFNEQESKSMTLLNDKEAFRLIKNTKRRNLAKAIFNYYKLGKYEYNVEIVYDYLLQLYINFQDKVDENMIIENKKVLSDILEIQDDIEIIKELNCVNSFIYSINPCGGNNKTLLVENNYRKFKEIKRSVLEKAEPQEILIGKIIEVSNTLSKKKCKKIIKEG